MTEQRVQEINTMGNLLVRKATLKDVSTIHQLINNFADKGLLLGRSMSELYDHIRDFHVLEVGAECQGKIVGVCGLGICWEDLAEIKSLAVSEEYQGRQFGRTLVHACLEDAKALGIKRVFTLTYVPKFFQKIGFQVVEKSSLPHKVWADCLKCPKFPDCDETALIKEL